MVLAFAEQRKIKLNQKANAKFCVSLFSQERSKMNKFTNFDDPIKHLKNNNYGKEAIQSFLFSMYGVHLTNENGTGFVSLSKKKG